MSRTKTFLTGLIGAVPVACGMIACACAFPTAFGIKFSHEPLILFCIAASLLLSFWMTAPKYGFGFGALYLSGMILLIVFCADRIECGIKAFFQGSDINDLFVQQILPNLPEKVAGFFRDPLDPALDPELSVSLLLMTVSGVAGILLAYSQLRSNVAALPLLIPLPMILLSFAIKELPPDPWTIILLCIYYGFALFGNGFKKGASPQRGLFLATLLIAVLALCAVLKLAVPENKEADYTLISDSTWEKLFSDLFGDASNPAPEQSGSSSPHEIRLDAEREHGNGENTAFSVRADHAGIYHLRVRSYGAYSGESWLNADAYGGEWHALEALGNRQRNADARMEIRGFAAEERIVPYAFRADGVETEETCIKAKDSEPYEWRYTQSYCIDPHPVTDAELEYYRFALERYTMPDGKEKQALLALAENEGIRPPEDPQEDVYAVYETALQVASYVRGDRRYTLDPEKTPDGQDFVLYFLTQGNEGYCVHFASATTAMLQAMDIPARYTSGYYVVNISDEWTTVPENARHAWAEVYLCGVGWIPIESTQSFPPNPPLSAVIPQEPTQQTSMPTSELPTSEPVPSTPGSNEPEQSVPSPVPELSEPQTDPQKQPGSSGNGASSEENARKQGAWWLLLLIPVVPMLWVGAYLLTRNRREARFSDPDVRRAIPEMTYYLRQLERYGIGKDPDAERWAEEAAFSDHDMQAERKELKKRVRAAQKAVYRDKPLRRFLLRWLRFML